MPIIFMASVEGSRRSESCLGLVRSRGLTVGLPVHHNAKEKI